MAKDQTTRVAIYGRFSDEMQNPRSAVDQIEMCREYATRQGWHVVLEERDEAVRSGATAKRVGYQRLLQTARERRFDVLLVEEVSRFSRDMLGGFAEFADLAKLGVRLADTKTGVFGSAASDKFRMVLQLFLGEQETEVRGQRTHRGLLSRTKAGLSSGGAPAYGYRREPKWSPTEKTVDGQPKRAGVAFAVAEDEANVVREMFQLFIDGATIGSIARLINTRGVPTRRAGRRRGSSIDDGSWSSASVRCILGNSLYIGERVWGRHVRSGTALPCGKKRQHRVDDDQVTRVPDFAPAIVDRETWDDAQRKLVVIGTKHRRDHVANEGRKHLLSGLIRCASCGSSFVIGLHVGKVGHYVCNLHRRGNAACANASRLSREAIERSVRRVLDVIMKDPTRLAELVAEHNGRVRAANAAQTEDIRALEKQLKQVERQRDNLVSALASGDGGAPPAVLRAINEREQKLAQLRTGIDAAAAMLQPQLLPRLAAVQDFVTGGASVLPDDAASERAFVEAVVDRIDVAQTGDVVLRFKSAGLFEPVREVHLASGYDITSKSIEAIREQVADLGRFVHHDAPDLPPMAPLAALVSEEGVLLTAAASDHSWISQIREEKKRGRPQRDSNPC